MTSIRTCGPKRDAVRGATYDLLDARPHAAFGSLPGNAYAFLSDRDREKLQVRHCVMFYLSHRSTALANITANIILQHSLCNFKSLLLHTMLSSVPAMQAHFASR